MQESKRQKQVARLIQEELTLIFQKEGLSIVQGGMISIADVKIMPDLLEARIYLSFYQIKNEEEILQLIKEKTPTIRGQLGNKLRHQLRRIPVLSFFTDNTLEEVDKLEQLLKKINNPNNNN